VGTFEPVGKCRKDVAVTDQHHRADADDRDARVGSPPRQGLP
jgi:hypothetical protein